MNIFKNNGFNYLILFVISLITLTAQDHSVNAGLDGSYFWAFNYLISHQPFNLDKITFIYGPLAFLHSPLYYGWLIIIGCFYQLLAKFTYGWVMLKVSAHLKIRKETVFVIFFISCIVVFSSEAWLNMLTILLLMLYFFERKNYQLYLIAFISIIGYYFKCSIGLSAFLFQGIFFIHDAVANKKPDYKLFLRIIFSNFLFFLLIGFILFRSLIPVFDTVVIYYQNIKMFNETSAFYNGSDNLILLVICFLALISVFYFNSNPEFRLFWWMTFAFLFMGYTHSIVRMDHSHYMGFLVHLFLAILACGLFYQTLSKNTFALLGTSFFCFYGNLQNKKDFSEFFLSVPNGPANFANYVFAQPRVKSISKTKSAINLKPGHKIPASWIEIINKSEVDFFPWDFGFVESNQIKTWKPRPYLQNLNMSLWFDRKTATYFKSKDAPEYIIWHGGNSIEFMNGIDNSYLPNNEFYTLTALFSNYFITDRYDNILLLKKKTEPVKVWVKDITEKTEIKSGVWINLPEQNNILGCSITYDFNFLRGLKKQFYRDDEFFIEYKSDKGQRYKKRIWPTDANSFLWLNPFISNISDSTGFKQIKSVRFSNTNSQIHSGKIKIQFKTLQFENKEPVNSETALKMWFNAQ